MENQIRTIILESISTISDDISFDDCYGIGKYNVIYKDVLNQKINDLLKSSLKTEQERIIRADEITQSVLEKINAIKSYSWAVKEESESCAGCPAYQSVIHKNGTHVCRLGFIINEKEEDEWVAKPMETCLRPLTVGASYQIAKELGRPEPLVGKLDADQYDQYLMEKKADVC